jgi:hypothetical protein
MACSTKGKMDAGVLGSASLKAGMKNSKPTDGENVWQNNDKRHQLVAMIGTVVAPPRLD